MLVDVARSDWLGKFAPRKDAEILTDKNVIHFERKEKKKTKSALASWRPTFFESVLTHSCTVLPQAYLGRSARYFCSALFAPTLLMIAEMLG